MGARGSIMKPAAAAGAIGRGASLNGLWLSVSRLVLGTRGSEGLPSGDGRGARLAVSLGSGQGASWTESPSVGSDLRRPRGPRTPVLAKLPAEAGAG